MLVDSHCHLDFDKFDEDRTEVLTRAFDAGVGMMVTIIPTPASKARVNTSVRSSSNLSKSRWQWLSTNIIISQPIPAQFDVKRPKASLFLSSRPLTLPRRRRSAAGPSLSRERERVRRLTEASAEVNRSG